MTGRKDDGGAVKKALRQKRKVRFEDQVKDDTPRSDSKRRKSSSSSRQNPSPLSKPDQLAASPPPEPPADLTPAEQRRQAEQERRDTANEQKSPARLREGQAQQRKLFNMKNTKKYAAGLRRFVADPPAYRREVAARCARIFIHDSYARAFVKWLRQLDRAARLECRYFHAVNWEPRKVTDGETEVWVV
ncbi:hypothetical protein VdG2_01065 [Verticillium dahliae VDG2]|nr:hypothetical protein VdG2_01065 [Verticillium dahliae VDG2]